MQQHTIEQLMHMIASNGLSAIHARLLQEKLADPLTGPSANALESAIALRSQSMTPASFFGWLENVLDNPIDPNGPFGSELNTLWRTTGKRPSLILVEKLKAEAPEDLRREANGWPPIGKRQFWVSALFLAFALIGIFVVLRAVLRRISE